MKLSALSTGRISMPLLLEGYGRVWDGYYKKWRTDPYPQILYLTIYTDPRTNKRKIGGINLNYLSPSQKDRLRAALPQILASSKMKEVPGLPDLAGIPMNRRRYHAGKALLRDIFVPFYRDLELSKFNVKKKGTIKFMSPDEFAKMGDAKAAEKLAQDREALKQARAARRQQVAAGKRPVAPVTPAPVEPEVPEEPPVEPEPEMTAKRAKDAVDAKRAPKLATSIDRRVTAEVPPEEPEVPPEETEELPPPEEEEEEEL